MTPGHTVLIVDDDVSVAGAFALALESVGYVVHTARTAEDGLRLAECEHPAVIILDLRMPFINGTGFLYRLRAVPQQRDTLVMVVTGITVDEELRAELADLGAIAKSKPLGMAELIAAVGELISQPPASPVAPSTVW